MSFKIDSQAVIFSEPKSEEEAFLALEAIKQRKTVILNLARLNPSSARRVVDSLAGCTCAIDGHSFWIDRETYLFAPNSVEISAISSETTERLLGSSAVSGRTISEFNSLGQLGGDRLDPRNNTK